MSSEIINEIKNYHKKIHTDGVERQYYNYIKGKKVAIVGPSPWLNGRKMGAYIDSFDIVVRINQGIFLPKSSAEDYGSRTDIIYLSQRARDIYQANFSPEFDNVKYIAVLIQKKFDDYPPVKMYCYQCSNNLKNLSEEELLKKCNKSADEGYSKDDLMEMCIQTCEILEGEEYCLNKGWDETKNPQIGHTKCIFPDLDREYIKYGLSHKGKVIKREFSYPQYKFGVSLLTGVFAIVEMLQFHAETIEVIGFDFYQSIKNSIRESTTGSVDVTDVYCKGYRIVKQSFNLSHKDIEADQLNFFLHLYKNRIDFSPKSELLVDSNLKHIVKQSLAPQSRFNKYDDEYKNYIKGKKIAFVGPGPWLDGQDLGWLIDSFDIVIRPNMAIYLTEDKHNDLGKKTNVVYLNQNLRGRFGIEFPDPIKETCEYIIVQSFEADKEGYSCKYCKEPIEIGNEYYTESGLLDEEVYHFNCYQYIDYRLCGKKIVTFDSTKIMKKYNLKEAPLIGFSAICHLLEQEPSQLYAFNIDFYDVMKKKIAECRKNKTKDVKILHTDLYSSGYKIIGGLTEEHKDAEGNQLNEFIKLYNENKKVLHVDENLKRIIKEHAKNT